MAEAQSGLLSRIGDFAGKWGAYSALGSFVLYVFGYLALRFQLYTYGVTANLDVFDERYLFAGCRFLVFVGMALPNILLLLAVVLLPLYGIFRLAPLTFRTQVRERAAAWISRPYRLAVVSCVLSLLLIQLVLRQCLFLSNMLLREHPPDYWIGSVLLASDGAQALYFDGLVLGTGINIALVAYVAHLPRPQGSLATAIISLLVCLVAIEFLLLPVNYGILIGSTWLPRISQTEAQSKSSTAANTWLVWESKETLTYFVCDHNTRSLLSIPRKDSRISIVGYDPIFQLVTKPPCSLPD